MASYRIVFLGMMACIALHNAHANSHNANHSVLLVVISGIRDDFFQLANTGNLFRIAQNGVRAERQHSTFPGSTWSSLQTIATGLYAENHGIVEDEFYDPQHQGLLMDDESMQLKNIAKNFRTIPVTTNTVSVNWPIIGRTANWTQRLMKYIGDSEMQIEYLDDLKKKIGEATKTLSSATPSFVSVYIEYPRIVAEKYGHSSSKYKEALEAVDHELIGNILKYLETKDTYVNLVVIGDHGMSDITRTRNIDRLVRQSDVMAIVGGRSVLNIWPSEGRNEEIMTLLRFSRNDIEVFKKSELPEKLHYSNSERIAPIIAVAKESIAFIRGSEIIKGKPTPSTVFLASGPAFRQGVVGNAVSNINVYALLAYLLNAEPLPNNGTVNAFAGLLKTGYKPLPGNKYIATAISRLNGDCTRSGKSDISGVVYIAQTQYSTIFRVRLQGLHKRIFKLYVHESGENLIGGCAGAGKVLQKLRYKTTRGDYSYVLYIPNRDGEADAIFELEGRLLLTGEGAVTGHSLVLHDVYQRNPIMSRVACGVIAVASDATVAAQMQ